MDTYAQVLSQMIDIELSHVLWGLVAVVGWFIRRELAKMYDEIKSLREEVKANTLDLVKVKSHLGIE